VRKQPEQVLWRPAEHRQALPAAQWALLPPATLPPAGAPDAPQPGCSAQPTKWLAVVPVAERQKPVDGPPPALPAVLPRWPVLAVALSRCSGPGAAEAQCAEVPAAPAVKARELRVMPLTQC
jgi:hypothetical protein